MKDHQGRQTSHRANTINHIIECFTCLGVYMHVCVCVCVCALLQEEVVKVQSNLQLDLNLEKGRIKDEVGRVYSGRGLWWEGSIVGE